MQSKVRQNKINGAIESTLKNIGNLIDVNTVVGSPIKVDNGEYIIPISKVTVGILAGGGEYGKLSIFQKGEDHPYSAGNGSIISVKPCGFLIKDKEKYKMISVSDSAYEKLLDKATDFLSEINSDD